MILMHAIKRSFSLIKLNLSSTEIGPKGAERVFKALRLNESVVSLTMSNYEGSHKNVIGKIQLD